MSKSALGGNLRKGKAPANIVLDMWTEVMNEAERDIKAKAKEQARRHGKPFKDWEAIENAAWAATSAKVRNRLANSLLMMHRQLDPDFYPAPNTTDSTAAPAQKTVTKAWVDVLRLCAKKLTESYIFKAADKLNSSGITCHGAVPGVGGHGAVAGDAAGVQLVGGLEDVTFGHFLRKSKRRTSTHALDTVSWAGRRGPGD